MDLTTVNGLAAAFLGVGAWLTSRLIETVIRNHRKKDDTQETINKQLVDGMTNINMSLTSITATLKRYEELHEEHKENLRELRGNQQQIEKKLWEITKK